MKESFLFRQKWGTIDNIMYVVGATRAEMLKDIRQIVPDHFLLVPGVGAQGGNLEEVAKYGMTSTCGLLVNSSRGIIFADNSEKFDKAAGEKASEMQQEMEEVPFRKEPDIKFAACVIRLLRRPGNLGATEEGRSNLCQSKLI